MSDNKESKKVNIEIDGENYEALSNQTIIQIADNNGIYIPRFCYHKKLSVAANCRMCLVDVEGARRSSPACATPVAEGMKIKTRSEKTLQMQKDVMEFLLINHPLDCPICDQGGECELQDVAVGYGNTTSEYKETKRAVPNPDLGPLVETDMTRCILCTRCVRFGEEIAGVKELGVMGRGDHSEISTYMAGDMVNSELSGNVIDLCPVGALTSKPFKFTARPWELKQYPSVSGGDALASDLNVHVYQNKIVRAVPRENENGDVWISDRDRFEYTGLYSKDRVQAPMIKKSGEWINVSWEEALDFVKVAIEQTIEKDGAETISAIVSESSTSEEMFLMKKLLQSIGSSNIDSRVRQGAVSNGVTSGVPFNCTQQDIEESDFIFILGSNLRKESPLINANVKQAADNGAKIVAWNVSEYDFNYPLEQDAISVDNIEYTVVSLLKAIIVRANVSYSEYDLDDVLRQIDPCIEARTLAESLFSAKAPTIIIGQDIVSSSNFDIIFGAISLLKDVVDVYVGFIPTNVNSVGAAFAGVVPGYGDLESSKFSALECLSGASDTKLLFTMGTEIGIDSILGEKTVSKVLNDIDVVVAFSSFVDDAIKGNADIILPIATHYGTSGSFVNMFGKVKEFKQVVKPYADNKELWRILRVLGNLLSKDGFDYNNASEITSLIYANQNECNVNASDLVSNFAIKDSDICFVASSGMYDNSSLIRVAEPLQSTKDAMDSKCVRISRYLADNLFAEGTTAKIRIYDIDNQIELDAIIDDTLAARNIVIPRKMMQSFLYNSSVSIKLIEK